MTRDASRSFALIAAVGWCGLIYASSATVITARTFYDWVSTHALTDEASFRTFAAFWGVGWFAVVKGWHATEYALLFWLLRAGLGRLDPARPGRVIAWSLGASLAFAASDEYHQSFVPGRNGTMLDVAIDGLGAVGAAGIAIVREQGRARLMFGKNQLGGMMLAALSLLAGGCNTGPPQPVLYRYEVGNYHVECDGEQKKITSGGARFWIVRNPEDIEVFQDTLFVGQREYGKVAKDDRISVVADKVAVNGQLRESTDPKPEKAVKRPKDGDVPKPIDTKK